MALFSSPSSYLGIDFDLNSVKVVELGNEHGRPRLVTYGYVDHAPEISQREVDRDGDKEIAKLVKHICKRAKVTTTKVITALPAFSVFSSILTLPMMSKKDLASAIKWEAKKVVPMPIDDMILDWKPLESLALDSSPRESQVETARVIESAQGKKYAKVLLTAAPKDLVKRYIDIFKNAGLNLLSLDTESFALIRALIGNDKSALMVVDMGSVVTTITVVVNAVPVLSRSIDVGGLTVTKAIANSLNISMTRAEQFKYDIGMSPDRTGQGSVPQTIVTSLTPIIDEIKYSLNIYQTQQQKPIEKVILTGGSSLLSHLPEYLSQALGLRVFLGDPWARVIYPEDLRPVLQEIGPRFSVGIGLAMRDIE